MRSSNGQTGAGTEEQLRVSGIILDPGNSRSGSAKPHYLNPEQTAPYVALCGCTVTIASEGSSYCGQTGRVCRVFWRPEPWVLVRLRSGVLLALPWSWTKSSQAGSPV